MAARKRNISAGSGNQDNKDSTATASNAIPSTTANQNAQNYRNDAKSTAASRIMNILVSLFIIAMLNPLLFNALDFLQSYNNIQHKLTPKREFPYEWETYTYNDIREYFNCRQRSKDMDKPLPTLDDWNLLRKAYTLIVDSAKKWNDPVPPTEGYSFEQGKAVPPPYYAMQSEGKGRVCNLASGHYTSFPTNELTSSRAVFDSDRKKFNP